VTASDNGLSLGIRLLPGETAARLDEYLRDAKGSFVSFLSSVHIAPVEFALDFDASESRCMEATGLVWSIDPVYCIASILVLPPFARIKGNIRRLHKKAASVEAL